MKETEKRPATTFFGGEWLRRFAMSTEETEKRPAKTFYQVNILKNEVKPSREIGSRCDVLVSVVAWEGESYVNEYLDEQRKFHSGVYPGVVPEGKTRVEIRYPSLQALTKFRGETHQWRASQITP